MSEDSSAADSINAFILTRQWVDTGEGLELTFWMASEAGTLRLKVLAQEAVSFFPSEQLEKLEGILPRFLHKNKYRINSTQLKNFDSQPVSALYLKSQRQLYDLRDRLMGLGVTLLEADIKPTDRFLMERFITGAVSVDRRLMSGNGFQNLISSRMVSTEYRPKLSAVSIDIETDYEAKELYSIAIYSNEHSIVLMCNSEEKDIEIEAGNAELMFVRYFPSSRDLLEAFIAEIQDLDPDVIMGWNVVNFDLRCLQRYCDEVDLQLKLGRNWENVIWRKAREGNDRYYALLPGRIVLDGIELMRTATYQFENFSLEHVARKLLNRGKLVEDVDQRGAEITDLYKTNKEALARYNLEDCRLVWDIFVKENLIGFAIERSMLTGLELDRYGGSVAAFDFLYLPRLHRQGYVSPSLSQQSSNNISPGGYVMRSVPGIHDNVIVLDFKSLYPSIIRTFNVDPLALVIGLNDPKAIEGYDGGRFSRSESILPELIEMLWRARDRAKADQNAVLSQAIKIIMNSFYGVLGTTGCRFLDSRLVSSITKRGHEIIIESKKFIESNSLEVIYGDTDSVFVLLGDVDPETVADKGAELAGKLNDWWQKKLEEEHGVESHLEIEFETHFTKFLMPTIRGSDAGSKKRYAGLIRDYPEGNSHILFKGLETVRSDWSPLARGFQQVLYERIFLNEPFEDYIKETVAKMLSGGGESELVLRKRLRRKLVDYVKNVPPHVQAARKAERIRKERGLPSLYESGGWIEYIMTLNGPEPAQYRESAIDYDFYFEKQLAPIADAILVFKSSSMNEIMNKQIGLF